MENQYVICRDRALNDFDANMSEKDKAKKRLQEGQQWWNNTPKSVCSIVVAGPTDSKVKAEHF